MYCWVIDFLRVLLYTVKRTGRHERIGLGVEGVKNMSIDPRMIHLYSYYRDAELRGAALLLKLTKRVEDTDSQIKLSRHPCFIVFFRRLRN